MALPALLAAQRGRLFLWVPVLFGVGIGLYFGLPREPSITEWGGLATLLAGLLIGRRMIPDPVFPTAILCLCAGLGAAGLRAHAVAEPVLAFRYYGPIEGRIVVIDRSASNKVRLTLDRVVLERMAPARTPSRVRVSLHGIQGFVDPAPGLTVILTGHLGPPEGPVEPGGFDFQRMAWFKGLGAVGYTRTPVLALAPPGRGLPVTRARMAISAAVQEALPDRRGAFAAAILTGDRSGMDPATLDALRAANLAHLLAISGLHMGLLTGFVFGALRWGLAVVPGLALRWPLKKIAALGALIAGAVYLALSGGNVATERAYIMAAVVLVAVLLDRRALTLRAVALAALIVLLLRPEALVSPGFQMSFAATTALIAVFGATRGLDVSGIPWILRALGTVLISSAVAGLATAPFAAAHFNQVPHYGLLANLLSVPLMGMVIIPAAVLAAVLAPLGLGWIGLGVMAPAIGWILNVADRVAAAPGAVSQVVAPGPLVLPLLTLGGLWLVLWQGRARWAGPIAMAMALGLWTGVERPLLLVAPSGGLIGVLTNDGRALSKPRGDGFAARTWLENDGDPADQTEAAERRWPDLLTVAGTPVRHVTGREAADRARNLCRPGTIVITTADVEFVGPCDGYAPSRLREIGALAITPGPDGASITSAQDLTGDRLWRR
ncbi:MAG: ComEC/Rec2 family competence protein [Pseudomonadota bacterium]